jgi:hypothetical protein
MPVMARLYLAAYHAATPRELIPNDRMTPTARAYAKEVHAQTWPYDLGDDPSFFSSKSFAEHGGRLTWGVCRRDVRNAVSQGDVVAFFGFRDAGEVVEYTFCAFATVEQKVTQADIWSDEELSTYRAYLNVLIRPAGPGFIHHETSPSPVHEDWLWRMVDGSANQRQLDFASFVDGDCAKEVVPGRDKTAEGVPIFLAPNYVLFAAPPDTLVLRAPPVVAVFEKGGAGHRERWCDDAFSRGLWELTIGLGPGRGLRTSPTGFQHRHLRLAIDRATWVRSVRALVERHGLSSELSGV